MRILLNYFVAILAISVLTLSSCTKDGKDPIPATTPNTAPTVTVTNKDGSSFSGTFKDSPVGTKLSILLKAEDAEKNLKTISFKKNGQDVDASSGDIRIDSFTTIIAANPLLVAGTDTAGFSRVVYLTAPSSESDSVTYTITVADAKGLEASTDVKIITEDKKTRTQFSKDQAVFWNRSGKNNGGLDLDNGTAVSSSSDESELQDKGIDQNGNWLKQFEAENGAELRAPSSDDNIVYSNVQYVEEISDFYDRGTTLSITGAVTKGDIFLVRKGTRTYLIEVSNVVETSDNNDDYYEVNIKY